MRGKQLTTSAWLILTASALASFISAFAFINWLAGGYGSKSGTLLEWISIIFGPPATFMAGLGLLRGWRWARVYMIALLLVVVTVQGNVLLFSASGPPTTTIGPDRVPTMTFHTKPASTLPILAVSIALLAVLFSAKVRAEFAAPAAPAGPLQKKKVPQNTLTRADYDAAAQREIDRGWRAGHDGRDRLYYEESFDRNWRAIQIDGEFRMGPARHIIFFASEETWQNYPEWARHDRNGIMTRIKSGLPGPYYEYASGGTARATPPPPPAAPAPAKGMTGSEFCALAVYLACLLGITANMAWLVTTSLQRHEIHWPSKHHTPQRIIAREKEPAVYWTTMAIYCGIGLGTFGLSARLIRWSLPRRGN